MILLTCAVNKELAFFKPVPHVEMLVTGVGLVEASATVARALAQSSYTLVINAGIAGAFEGRAQIGDGVVISEELLPLRLEGGEPIALPDGAPLIERASSDFGLVERLGEAGFSPKRGLTVTQVTATQATATQLAQLADIESMEGFGVLRAAEMAGIPAVEVRGISNIVTDRAKSGWNFSAGVRGLEHVLNTLLGFVAPGE